MSLGQEFQSALSNRRPPCKVRDVYGEMEEKDRNDLRDALANVDFPLTVISSVLAGRGVQLSTDTLRKHRMGRCSCDAER